MCTGVVGTTPTTKGHRPVSHCGRLSRCRMRGCTQWPPHPWTAAPSSGCCSSAQQMRSSCCCSLLAIPRKTRLCLRWHGSRWKTSWWSCEPSAGRKESIPADSWSCHCCFCASSPYVAFALAVYVSFSASNLLTAVSSQALCLGQLLLPIWPGHCSRWYVEWHLNDFHHLIFLMHCGDESLLELEYIFSLYFCDRHLHSYFNLGILMKVVLKYTKRSNWAVLYWSMCAV